MARIGLFKKRDDRPAGADGYGGPKPEAARMLETIRGFLQQDFHEGGEQTKDAGAFYRILEKEVRKYAESQKRDRLPVDSLPLFYVSADCMDAYACILPPLNDGRQVDKEHFLEDMRYEGIAAGIDQSAVDRLMNPEDHLRITHIAQGRYPVDGIDGRLEELYQRRYDQSPELDEKEMLQGQDFRKKNLIQTIREGEVLCRVTPPVPSQDGFDVSGTVLHGRDGLAVRMPQGKYTSISEDGLLLRSDISGIVVMENDNFTIKSQRVMSQDINAGVGNLRFDGDIYIRGNVDDGVTVEATGNVMIIGNVRDAKILSGGTICIQGDVKGTSRTTLKAAKQIQCMIMENVTATAVEDVYAGVMANCDILSEKGSVYALMGRGLIFGSNVTSCKSVYAKKIVNISSCVNDITLGLEAEFERRKRSVKDELEEINRTLEQLRKNISNMQILGMTHRSDSQKEYNDLVEQRTTYGELKREKLDELDELNKNMRAIRPGSIVCDNIYPVTKVHIDNATTTIDQRESDCNIHLQSGQILLQ